MKPSHLKTPRTMNEGVWMSGYQRGSVVTSRAEDVAGMLLAVAIGIGLAALLVAWWSS